MASDLNLSPSGPEDFVQPTEPPIHEPTAAERAAYEQSFKVGKLMWEKMVDEEEKADISQKLTIAQDRARTDELTGAASRWGLKEALEKIVSDVSHGHRVTDPAHLGTAIFGDVDKFKDINDKLGHGKGDEALIETVANMRKVSRKTDVVARVGGDEFVILLPGAAADTAREKAEELKKLNQAMGVTLTLGVVPVMGDITKFLDHGRAVMAKGKDYGRNIVIMDPALLTNSQ